MENRKTMENHRNKTSLQNWILSPEVIYVVVLTFYNTHSKVVHLTRYTKMMWFSRCLILPENNIKNISFLFYETNKDNYPLIRISIHNRIIVT